MYCYSCEVKNGVIGSLQMPSHSRREHTFGVDDDFCIEKTQKKLFGVF